MKKYSLHQLQVYLQRVITLNFQEPVWVTAEISKSKASRGHIFLELVEKRAGDDEICAQGKAALWSRNIPEIASSLSVPLEDLLKEGTEVSIQIEVSYHTMHGLSFSVIDIDVEYTLGRMELHRQETIVRLKREGLLQLNAQIALPDVIQRIAVISSSSASGYQDFIHHLDQNEYSYDFQVDLFPSAMQGTQLESEVCAAMAQIAQQNEDYDVIVLIRGGGSKLDLAGFDLYEVAKAISQSRLPVFTGIGHETDTTICDMVAHHNFRTPTAVASFIVDHQLTFERKLILWVQQIKDLCNERLSEQKESVARIRIRIRQFAEQMIRAERLHLETTRSFRLSYIKSRLLSERLRLEHHKEKIQLLDPRSLLRKGYTFTMKDGKRVKSVSELEVGNSIETIYVDGRTHSTVNNIQ